MPCIAMYVLARFKRVHLYRCCWSAFGGPLTALISSFRGSFAPEARRWCRPTTLARRIQPGRLDRHAVRCGFSVPEEHRWCNLEESRRR
eukprot:4952673-Prymnesium_polylepis.1